MILVVVLFHIFMYLFIHFIITIRFNFLHMHLDVLSKKFLNFDDLKRFKIRPFDVFINIFGILKEIIELFCFCKTNIAQLFIII